jgi:hypothetical protein
VTFGRGTPALYTVNTGVVDDRIHPANRVNLFSDLACIGGTGKVSEDDAKRFPGQIPERNCTFPRAGVQNNLMAVIDEGSCRGKT